MAKRLGGLLCGVLLAVAVASPAGAAEPAPAATDADAPVAVDQRALVDPAASVAPAIAPADEPTSAQKDEGDDHQAPAEPSGPPAPAPPSAVTRTELARGNAALQSEPAKAAEARRSCDERPAPTSQLLAVGGSVASDPPESWTLWAVVACLAAAGVAASAFTLRKHGPLQDDGKGPLEHVATAVAIAAGVAALAGQFVPGIGVHDAPPPAARMEVRDVNARVTRGDFAKALDVPQPRSEVDRREIGNVVWLAIHLEGYAGRKLTLQWGSYDLEHGERFVPGSDKKIPLEVMADTDEQTVFQPIWVGYPQKAIFQVAFRLLEGGRVREIASTNKMRGALYRYSCPSKA